RGSTSAQVLVLIDGRPVNSISTGSADLSEISLDNIEKIEIIRGPSSHLFGANAMGGVVNIVTKDIKGEPYKKVYGSYGSYNTYFYGLDYGRTSNKWSYIITGSTKKTDGYRDNSDFFANDLFLKLKYNIDNNSLSQINIGYHDNKSGLPGPVPEKGTQAKYGNSEVTTLFDNQKNKNYYVDFTVDLKRGEKLHPVLKLWHDERLMKYFVRYDDWFSFPADVMDENDTYKSKSQGGSICFQFDFARYDKLIMGVDAKKDKYDAEQKVLNTTQNTTIVTNWMPSSDNTGIWLENQWNPSEQVSVTLGARNDNHSLYGSNFSPSIGMAYKPDLTNTLRTAIGKAFRAPSFNDLYWPKGGNKDLKSETGLSYELSFEHWLSSSLMTQLGVFKRDTDNKIAWAPKANGDWEPQNINKHKLSGVELELLKKLKLYSFGVSYTFLDAEQENKEIVYSDWLTGETKQEFKNRRAAFTPKHELAVKIGLNFEKGTKINFNTRYISERYNYYPNYNNSPQVTMDTKKLPDYFVADIKLSQNIKENYNIFLSVNNILDKKYKEQFGTTFKDQGYPMPPRTISGGIEVKF
ncbi:MAG: TonB-dependent receptor, partial [Candidatus Firestonebacteria bacterium]|nr:TonB-dependent receptor [Candidatus Firestonebacteria bacterium]